MFDAKAQCEVGARSECALVRACRRGPDVPRLLSLGHDGRRTRTSFVRERALRYRSRAPFHRHARVSRRRGLRSAARGGRERRRRTPKFAPPTTGGEIVTSLLSVETSSRLIVDTTLSQTWSGNSIRGPQCAFETSMFMCPAVHKLTRN